MPFVKRDEQGEVIAVSQESGPGFTEELAIDDPTLVAFISSVGGEGSTLADSDLDLIRVVEDVVELLIAKGLILFTELPENAQQKIMRRQQMRSKAGNLQDLISKD
jgi:hypothetical protein